MVPFGDLNSLLVFFGVVFGRVFHQLVRHRLALLCLQKLRLFVFFFVCVGALVWEKYHYMKVVLCATWRLTVSCHVLSCLVFCLVVSTCLFITYRLFFAICGIEEKYVAYEEKKKKGRDAFGRVLGSRFLAKIVSIIN